MENVVFQQDNFPSAFSAMAKYRQDRSMCDVVLKVGEQRFYAHKLVLASTIPYFRAMFMNDTIEFRNNEINIENLDATALGALVNFAYSGKILLDVDNVRSIIIGASHLLLNGIRDACVKYILQEEICPQNALELRRFAMSFDCATLVEPVEKYIEFYFQEVSLHEEYLKLSLTEVKNLLSKNNLRVECEEQVFEACIRWIKHDVGKRKEHLPELLSSVRLSLLSPVYITERVLNEDQIKSSVQCRDLVDKALTAGSFESEPRVFYVTGYIYAIGSYSSDKSFPSALEYYNSKLDTWQTSAPLLNQRSDQILAVVKNKLYAIGGRFKGAVSSCVDVYDPVKNEWSVGTPMTSACSEFGATVLRDKIYVCGGWDGSNSLNSVARFDPSGNSWCTLAPMTRKRTQAAVVACQGYIYAAGGCEGRTILDSVERYNPATNTWEDVAPMQTKWYNVGAATLNGKLYACGGSHTIGVVGGGFLQTVEMYDPFTNKWTYVAPMNTKRYGVAVTANMGKLWAVGGCNGPALGTMEVYDPKQDRWTYVADMIAHQGHVSVGVIPFPVEDV